MMAKSHVLTGVLFVTGTAALADFSPTTFALAITTIPGFALFPDIDHAKSMVSSTYGWVTRSVSLLLGHRRETHCFPGIAFFGVVTWVAATWHEHLASKIWLTFMLVLAWAAFLRVFKIKGRIVDLVLVAAAFVTIWYRDEWVATGGSPYPLETVPVAVVLGMLLHVAGDVLTNSGCPLWWPFSKKRTALSFGKNRKGKKRALKTNAWYEHKIIVPLLWLGVFATTALWAQGLV